MSNNNSQLKQCFILKETCKKYTDLTVKKTATRRPNTLNLKPLSSVMPLADVIKYWNFCHKRHKTFKMFIYLKCHFELFVIEAKGFKFGVLGLLVAVFQ